MGEPNSERREKRRYYLAMRKQMFLWCNGISKHDHEYNECCPDFSCCQPDLGTPMQDRPQVMHYWIIEYEK